MYFYAVIILGKPAGLLDMESPDWIPSVNLQGKVGSPGKRKRKLERYERIKKRRSYKVQLTEAETVVPDVEMEPEECQNNEAFESIYCNKCCQTEVLQGDLQLDNLKLREEIFQLRDRLAKMDLDQDSFMNDNKKTLFFTGLPNADVLLIVYNAVEPFIKETAITSLTKFQQLLLTLMKLRLNLYFKYLAYRFGVSQQTASRVFYNTINILYCRLKTLVFWPDRNDLRHTMPLSFQESFGKQVAVIIDCFEIFTEKPGNFLAASSCWSNYKHHHTVKVLIGICPQGAVSFVSEAWGGRASDKFIVEHSTLLDNLLPGDVILADRGFRIYDIVNACSAEIKIPDSAAGKKQLSSEEVENTRNIAHVRIHIERVIGALRQKFTILDEKMPISTLTSFEGKNCAPDRIIRVCCALLNLCPSIVTE